MARPWYCITMRTIWTLLACLALTGCLVDTYDDEGPMGDETSQESPSGYPEDVRLGGDSAPGCGFQVLELIGPDGEPVVVAVPLECSPTWFDMGDPPPEETDEDELTDPTSMEVEQVEGQY